MAALVERDARFAPLVGRWGLPPLWTHPPGFAGLMLAILAQQVSIESARAAFAKLERAIPALRPQDFLALADTDLRTIGFSRQKADYGRDLATAMVDGAFDPAALRRLDDEAARQRLLALRGVGPWTADTYLLFSLRRVDVWPTRDLAPERAVSELEGAGERLDSATVDRIALGWRPLRAVAARLLWAHYLEQRGRL
ncbi:MAG TPA: DNA-3-methyladenine glycosylase 2 family protein [Candidatus Desulfobacillus denitrificans]|nr:DNA-3-methyladenine glycosylase 2 family protein [Candidatus Desulfobacillus denitrificans]HNT63296.1 DNA-3-methyladenine glycosylase 2 family protein [Candidatus Desulfobacillus denitrificans]